MTVDDEQVAPVPEPRNPNVAPPRATPHDGRDSTGRLDGTADDLDEERRDTAGIAGTRLSRGLRLGAVVSLLVLLGVWRGLPIVLVILSLLVCIFLHELGHYVAARRSGMKATEFFIGFGPRIFSFRRGETEFGLKAIPAGAYVRIIGMSNLEQVDPADEPRAYRQKPFRARLSVAVAGSTMHFAIAIILLTVQLAFIGWPQEGNRWEIGSITPGSAAAAAGLRQGDRILTIDGAPVDDYAAFRAKLADSPTGPTDLAIERDGQRQDVTADLSNRLRIIGTIGEDIDLLDGGAGVRIGHLAPTGQASNGGLTEGAAVTAINGRPISALDDVPAAVSASIGGVVDVRATSDGTESSHRIDLGSGVSTTEPGTFLGVGSQSVLETRSLPEAVPGAFAEFGRTAWASVVGIGQVFNPSNLVDFASSVFTGPQDTATTPTPSESAPASQLRPMSIFGAIILGSDATAADPASLIYFLIVLNIFLGVFNLIPLLPFDGGHVAIAVYEKLQEMHKRQRRYVADISKMLPVAYAVVFVFVAVAVLSVLSEAKNGVG